MFSVVVFQDEKLKKIVEAHGTGDWRLISSYYHDRSDVQCQHRWHKVLNPELIKGPWTKEVSPTFLTLRLFVVNLANTKCIFFMLKL